MSQQEFDRRARALLRAAVGPQLGTRKLRARTVEVRLDRVRAELVRSLCDAASLDEQTLIVRALDEYAVRHGMAAQVQRATRLAQEDS